MRESHLNKMPRGGTTTTRYGEESDNVWNCCSWCEYLLIIALSTILLVGVLLLTLFWIMFYRNGFAWSENAELQFNLHPILMIAGFITMSGFSILLYRLCRCMKHIYVKLVHMLFHLIAIPLITLGFLSVFESHNATNKDNFTSLHSWLGCATMGLFLLQFVFGFFSFILFLCCGNKTYNCRAAMVPIHASLGLATFWLAIITAVTGLIEREKSTIRDFGHSADTQLLEHFIVCAIALTLIVIGVIVTFAVRRTNAPTSAKVYVTERI